MLDRFAQREGLWCCIRTLESRAMIVPFTAPTREALGQTARYERDGLILVTTTRRLLGYCRALRSLAWSQACARDRDHRRADAASAADLAGLTVYVPDSATTRLRPNGREVGVCCVTSRSHGAPQYLAGSEAMEFRAPQAELSARILRRSIAGIVRGCFKRAARISAKPTRAFLGSGTSASRSGLLLRSIPTRARCLRREDRPWPAGTVGDPAS